VWHRLCLAARSASVSHHFLLQAPPVPFPCSVRKQFSSHHCCRGRSKPGCKIVGLHIRWEFTTWADFQLRLHRLLMSFGCETSHSGFLYVRCGSSGLRISDSGFTNCPVRQFSPPACQWQPSFVALVVQFCGALEAIEEVQNGGCQR